MWRDILICASGFIGGCVATAFATFNSCFHPDHSPPRKERR